MATPSPPTFASLPPELRLHIHSYLCYNDVQSLRSTSHSLFLITPPPTAVHLNALKATPSKYYSKYLACSGCLKLLPQSEFDTLTPPHTLLPSISPKFCHKCGYRDLPGPHRYQMGDSWTTERGQPCMRCVGCGDIIWGFMACETCDGENWVAAAAAKW